MPIALPEILKTAKRRPSRPIENILVPIISKYVPEFENQVFTWIPYDKRGQPYMEHPWCLVRQTEPNGSPHSRPDGLVQSAYVELQIYVQTTSEAVNEAGEIIDPEDLGMAYAEAALSALYTARDNYELIPGAGSLNKIRSITTPRRVADWATSAGPVQYADLPTGAMRFEQKLEIWYRPDLSTR